MCDTRHDWITLLAGLSPVVAALNLTTTLKDELYYNRSKNMVLQKDAFNLSSSKPHNDAIASWLNHLAAMGVGNGYMTKALTDLTSRNTIGTFCELSAYGALLDHNIPFLIQIAQSPSAILNPNGSDLDGCLQLLGDVFFDVKAFGLQEHLIDLLVERLQTDLGPSIFVAAEGSKDVSIATLSDLLGGNSYATLISELMANNIAKRSLLEFRLKPLAIVQMSSGTYDPYRQAEECADYAFRFAKQFMRHKPFILVFVMHPWLGGLSLHTNFAGGTDKFLRSFARRTFMQFLRDTKNKHFNLTRRTVSRLLSGMLVISAWQGKGTDAPTTPPKRLFLNPRAKNPLSPLTVHLLRAQIRDLEVEDFLHDTY
ncbi:MAG: hypothetical protein P4L81_06230 [Candidatus Pacebacteria bacterium]|nr:hypothetical protein [Candidatus Paceibacterota bacterium]